MSILLLAGSAIGCRPKQPAPPTPTAPAAVAPAEAPTVGSFAKSRFEAPGRLVAMGDVHGDFAAMHAALRAAAVIDAEGNWIGGDTTLVQTGDLLDRGDDEQRIVDFFETLRAQAAAAGGRLVDLNGNHEVMNVAGDLRYVTPVGFTDFEDVEGLDLGAPVLQRLPEHARARAAAFLPGGPYAKLLAKKLVIAIVNDTVFAHGGVHDHHAEYGVDAINTETSAWMLGQRDVPMILQGETSPIWSRVFSDGPPDCDELQKTLDALQVSRMVVGHTVQRQGITSACDGKVWRIDVGMAAHYGGTPAALEIDPTGPRAITAQKPD